MEDTVERTVIGLARTLQAAFAMKVHPRMGGSVMTVVAMAQLSWGSLVNT